MRQLAILALLFACSGCGGCDDPPKGAGTAKDPSDTTGDEGEGEGGEGEGDGGEGEGEPDSVTLAIEPQDPTLEATVGGSETLQLAAVLLYPGGQSVPAPGAFWASLAPEIGTVDANGLFTPSRERAGEVVVRARAAGKEATTRVRVVLHEDNSLGGTGSGADFDGPVAAAPLVVEYPEDGVVMPANLSPMVFQWVEQKAHARVVLSGAFGGLTLYTDGNEAQAPRDSWRRFLLAHIGSSFTATLEESDGPGSERVQRVLTLHLAAADLTSTVYYWAVDLGQIVRIDADSEVPQTVPIASSSGESTGCRACHSLSANGQRMSFTYTGGNGPGGVVDVNAPGAPVIADDPTRAWNFSALSPDGALLVSNYALRMELRDGVTGAVLQPDLSGGKNVAHPTFSPGGERIAFAGDITLQGGTPTWEIDFDASNLYVADVDPLARSVGAPRLLVPGGGRTLYWPSFNPSGSLVAYTDGSYSRSATPADLMLARADDVSGDAPRVKLVRANPNSSAYAPTFNPKVEGGYQWIAFYSRRNYGHRVLGRPQIWVAAVDANADPASALDPSHPAFWLPGQVESSENLSSYFAPKPCEQTGGLCDTDAGCCGDGLCRPVAGVSQCVPPDQACALPDDGCGADADCCEGLNCVVDAESGAFSCQPPGTVCADEGQLCQLDADCCEGAGLCTDDGSGVTRCIHGECSQLAESCNDNRPCCDPASLCSGGFCLQVGG